MFERIGTHTESGMPIVQSKTVESIFKKYEEYSRKNIYSMLKLLLGTESAEENKDTEDPFDPAPAIEENPELFKGINPFIEILKRGDKLPPGLIEATALQLAIYVYRALSEQELIYSREDIEG